MHGESIGYNAPTGRRSMRRGFTLIELMIVIAIVCILLLIFVPNMLTARDRALLSACKQNLKSLAAAIHMYQADNGGMAPNQQLAIAAQGPVYGGGVPTNSGLRTLMTPYLGGLASDTWYCPAKKTVAYILWTDPDGGWIVAHGSLSHPRTSNAGWSPGYMMRSPQYSSTGSTNNQGLVEW